MPYLTNQLKRKLEDIVTQLVMTSLASAGELNYLFTRVALRYVNCNGESYQTYNDIVGALENCKAELYRRKIGMYEDTKIESNGDVF